MHRKNNSMAPGYSNLYPERKSLIEISKASILFNSNLENSSHSISKETPKQRETKFINVCSANSRKSNGRKYSEIVSPIPVQLEIKELGSSIVSENKMSSLEQRVQSLERRLARTQKSVEVLGMNESKLINEYQMVHEATEKISQMKNYQISVCLNEIKQKLLNLSHGSYENYSNYNKQVGLQNAEFASEKVMNKLKKLNDELVESLRNQLKVKVGQINERIRRMQGNYQSPKMEFLKSNRKYFGTPVCFSYEERIRSYDKNCGLKTGGSLSQNDNRSKIGTLLGEYKYWIDSQGYLLDHDNYYLLDSHMNQIKLGPTELTILRTNNLLQKATP